MTKITRKQIQIESFHKFGGRKYWKIKVTNRKNKIKKYIIDVGLMKIIGVVDRSSSGDKMISWLNTPDGMEWLKLQIKQKSIQQTH